MEKVMKDSPLTKHIVSSSQAQYDCEYDNKFSANNKNQGKILT